MNATYDHRDSRGSLALAVVFGAIAVLVGIDLMLDLRAGTTPAHVWIEGLVVAIGLAAAAKFANQVRTLARDARELHRQTVELGAHLAESRADAERWKRDARNLIAGLGAAIDQQLERWGLSPAEKEVALLLLKGLSHKEIADARAVNETTVRQQARALYRKAGLSGRSDLAAFFLEDLLVVPPRP